MQRAPEPRWGGALMPVVPERGATVGDESLPQDLLRKFRRVGVVGLGVGVVATVGRRLLDRATTAFQLIGAMVISAGYCVGIWAMAALPKPAFLVYARLSVMMALIAIGLLLPIVGRSLGS